MGYGYIARCKIALYHNTLLTTSVVAFSSYCYQSFLTPGFLNFSSLLLVFKPEDAVMSGQAILS